MRFTAKKAAALIERAVVRLEAGFEHESHFVAVAEVFRAADTPAGTEFRGVFHRELINGVNAGLVSIRMNVGQTHVDDAVHLHVAGMSRKRTEGKCGSNRSESLAHGGISF